jgi:membrane protease YdiL (CAAX protease family)
VATLEQAGARSQAPAPGFCWRVLSPLGAVLAAFILLVVGAGTLSLTALSDDALEAILVFATSLLLLVFAVVLWLGLPAANRRAAVAVKGPLPKAVAVGVGMGLALVVGAGLILLAGSAIDSHVQRQLDEVDSIGTAPWQLVLTVSALVILAPLGEELLFRGLLLRGLARRLPFWAAAVVSSLLFASAHADSYVLWPRAIALAGTGVVLAWIYRRRGYWASVSAHATVNVVAAIALVASS